MIYLNPCLFFSLLVFVFFLNISCTFFSDTSCLVPWNLSEFLTDNFWYLSDISFMCNLPTHTHTPTPMHTVNSRIYLFKADTKLLFPCSDPTELQTAALTGKFSLFLFLFTNFPAKEISDVLLPCYCSQQLLQRSYRYRFKRVRKSKKYPLITKDKMSTSTSAEDERDCFMFHLKFLIQHWSFH